MLGVMLTDPAVVPVVSVESKTFEGSLLVMVIGNSLAGGLSIETVTNFSRFAPRLISLSVKCPSGAVAFPVRVTAWGLPVALSVILTDAEREPAAVGLNAIFNVALLEGGTATCIIRDGRRPG